MAESPCRVLFLCADNSASSLFAECVLNREGVDRFVASSAGVVAGDAPHPFVVDLLLRDDHPIDGLRPKAWSDFARPTAKPFDLILTLWEQAPEQSEPGWPGQPVTVSWAVSDPTRVEGTEPEQRRAFAETLRILQRRIDLLLELPTTSLDACALTECLVDIAQRR